MTFLNELIKKKGSTVFFIIISFIGYYYYIINNGFGSGDDYGFLLEIKNKKNFYDAYINEINRSGQLERPVSVFFRVLMFRFFKDSYSLYFRGTRFNNERGTATVHMILKLEQNRKVDTQFALYYDNDNDTWKIFNLAFEGINYGLVYRNTYNDIIKNHGIDALLKQMRERLK